MKRFPRHSGAAAAVFALALFAACSPKPPGSEAPATWAASVAQNYVEPRGDGAAIARMGVADQIDAALTQLRDALGEERNARIGMDRVGFILQYKPIWPADQFSQTEWDIRRARIALLPDADVAQWRQALARLSDEPPSEMWTIGYLADTPALFAQDAFSTARSNELLERLNRLSPEAVGLIAAATHLPRAWAAMLIVGNDALFSGADLDADKFARAVAALNAAAGVAPAAAPAAETPIDPQPAQPSPPAGETPAPALNGH